MKILKKISFLFIIFLIFQNNLSADTPHYLDFKYILNQSEAGKKAQDALKSKLTNGIKKLKKEEKTIIKQKSVISADEYKKKVTDLRTKVSKLQKDRNILIENVSKQRLKARSELLKNLNPIMKDYMKEKKIRMVIDKKSMLIADEQLDITKDIIKLLNAKIKSIKLN
jgi:Skp family chaperone for outer membrane proteins